MKKVIKKILGIVLSTCLLTSICYASENNTLQPQIITEDTKIIEQSNIFPAMYMQDFSGIKMPNGKDVSESGNLLIVLCQYLTYMSELGAKPVTPQYFIDNYTYAFDENGNLSLELFCQGYYGELYNEDNPFLSPQLFDFDEFTNCFAKDEGGNAIIRIPNPSKYGNDSTYLIVTGLYSDGTCKVRDPNKNNLSLATLNEYGEYEYSTAEIYIAVGKNGTMLLF